MPKENVSNSNSDCIITHASKVLQELSHLFSDFIYIFISCSQTSSILETEEANTSILTLQSEDGRKKKEEATSSRHPKSQKKSKHGCPDFISMASTKPYWMFP